MTNTTASPALNGQCVKVTLSGAESLSGLADISEGDIATCSSSSKTGTVYSVDYEGISFLVRPTTDSTRFDSTSTPGVLAASETITIS